MDCQANGGVMDEIWVNHYSNFQRILLVGEGDFSFSACLARGFGSGANMVATSFDSEGTIIILQIDQHLFLAIKLDLHSSLLTANL